MRLSGRVGVIGRAEAGTLAIATLPVPVAEPAGELLVEEELVLPSASHILHRHLERTCTADGMPWAQRGVSEGLWM